MVDYDGQLTFDDDPDALRMKSAINLLRLGQFAQAATAFGAIFEHDPDYPDIDTAIKAARFWENRADSIATGTPGLEKGKFLKDQWNAFESFIGNDERLDTLPSITAIRTFVFTEAIHCYTRAWESTIAPDISLIHDIGECYFNIRDFPKAAETFEYAWELKRDSSRILSRLADTCEAMAGDTRELRKRALLLFREAFLHNPREIEIERIRSQLIRHLASEVRAAGFTDEEVPSWLPIFAAFEHSFSVKRELEEHEVNSLQEQASRIEGELTKSGTNARIMLPLLLNRYIWLLDHYTLQVNDAVKAELVRKRFFERDSETYARIYSRQDVKKKDLPSG
jgi:tetratricopeptide (TPR) repeat protein